MRVETTPFTLCKRYPLTISRGTSASTTNLLVRIEHDAIQGIGEMAPMTFGERQEDAVTGARELGSLAEALADIAPWEMQRMEALIAWADVGPAARCALDMALHDWLGKRVGMPVYQLLGCDPHRIEPTSVTVGINPPEVVRERVAELVARTGARRLKVKLGSPEGIEADQAIFTAAREAAPATVLIRVDANGGWSLRDAERMIAFLAERGVEYVEQPLAAGREDELPALFRARRLPIFGDESSRTAADVPRLADRVDGVNLKLMKAGGIREGLRLIHTARAHGLQVMMGCMSESSLAIAASAAISSYADHLDLDSHLNLLPDHFSGLALREGRVLPSDAPGLGVHPSETQAPPGC